MYQSSCVSGQQDEQTVAPKAAPVAGMMRHRLRVKSAS